MNTKREPGYYRVRFKDKWRIGEYITDGVWFLTDQWNDFTDSELQEIDEHPISLEPINEKELDKALYSELRNGYYCLSQAGVSPEGTNLMWKQLVSQIKQLFRR